MDNMESKFNLVPMRALYGPASYCARGIENLLIIAGESTGLKHIVSRLAANILAVTVFPGALLIGLAVEPLALAYSIVRYYGGNQTAEKEWAYSAERLEKLALGLIFTPVALVSATDTISYLFLERAEDPNKILPFGVENVFGESLNEAIRYPSTVEEIQEVVKEAKKDGKTISVIGAGMSQGKQTAPTDSSKAIVINLKNMHAVTSSEKGDQYIKVQAGAIWEQVQMEANKKGKSVIVKQASDLFSVGGSIGINCHGWQHDAGSIASTVESLDIIDAEGNLRTVSRTQDPELFGSMFGTLGYFGIIVNATLRLEDNVYLQERVIESSPEEFTAYYKENIQGDPTKPLLMGRLNIDGKPLKQIHFNTFEKVLPEPDPTNPIVTENFEFEKHRGERIERIYLDAVGHLPKFLYDKMAKLYWDREVKIMHENKIATRNEFMHFGVKSFFQLHQSDLNTQWLQEYFISEENLPNFLNFLSDVLDENEVRLLNASIRPVPKDEISVLPYAEKERYAIVISFHQLKTTNEMKKTENWIKKVQQKLIETGDKWYQAYMPYATQKEFEQCYGIETVNKMRELKKQYDPDHRFSNAHTAKYYDKKVEE